MSLLLWAGLGLIAALVANRIVGGSGRGAVMDIVLGVVGALFGGWLLNTFGMASGGGLKLYSLLLAVVGASTLLLVYHASLCGVREALFNLDLEKKS